MPRCNTHRQLGSLNAKYKYSLLAKKDSSSRDSIDSAELFLVSYGYCIDVHRNFENAVLGIA